MIDDLRLYILAEAAKLPGAGVTPAKLSHRDQARTLVL